MCSYCVKCWCVFFSAVRWWELQPCVWSCIHWYSMCSYCVNICLFSFSAVSWWVLHGDKKAASNWDTMCSYYVNICWPFLFLLWVDGCCMVIRKLQVIEIPCAATMYLCSVIRSICFLFCSENWWKLMPCLLMLFIAVNMMFQLLCASDFWILSQLLYAWEPVHEIFVYCATVNAVWAAGFVTDYWNTCCSLWCVVVGVRIYKLCLFFKVSIESPVTVLGIQYLVLFRWFLYMCALSWWSKKKKKWAKKSWIIEWEQKVKKYMSELLAVKLTLYVTFTVYTCDNVLLLKAE